MPKSRSYVFTFNNYTVAEYERICALECVYLSVGEEVGESGTPHLQGLIFFKNARSFDAVRKLLGCHVEPCKSLQAAIDYTQKDGKFIEKGTRPMKPVEKGECNKKRYERAWDLAKEGRIEEIDADLRVRHFSTFKRIREDYVEEPAINEKLENYWLWGPTGTGKSHSARERFPDAYIKNKDRWWDGYKGQDNVIIEEWSPEEKIEQRLKVWADKYPFRAEIKGGSMMIRPKRIIVTSNYCIDECFARKQDADPIKRRFQEQHMLIKYT